MRPVHQPPALGDPLPWAWSPGERVARNRRPPRQARNDSWMLCATARETPQEAAGNAHRRLRENCDPFIK